MITKYTKETIKDVKKEDNYYSEFYYINSLVADKLRTIYTALGWSHMLGNFSQADDIVEELFSRCIVVLEDGADEVSASSGGVIVKMFFDEGFLCVDYSFNLE